MLGLSDLAFTELINLLQSPDVASRSKAASALGELGDKRASSYLLEALHDPEPSVRIHAALALGDLREERAVEPIIQMFKDEDRNVRGWAESALHPGLSEAALPYLLNLLRSKDADPPLRVGAAWSVHEMKHPDIVPTLLMTLQDPDPELRQISVNSLGHIDDQQAVESIIDALRYDPDSDVRWVAAKALARLGDRRAIPALIEALNDPSDDVSVHAIETLGYFRVVEAIDLIGKFADDPNPRIRRFAAYAFCVIGSRRACAYIAQLLNDHDEWVRRNAVYAVAGTSDITLIPKLRELATDPSEKVRKAVEETLAKLSAEFHD